MILEKDYGEVILDGKSFSLVSSNHSHQPRNGDIPRNTLTKTKLIKILEKAYSIKSFIDKEKTAIIWEDENSNFKGLLISVNLDTNKITIITAYMFNSKEDKLMKNIQNRIVIGKLN